MGYGVLGKLVEITSFLYCFLVVCLIWGSGMLVEMFPPSFIPSLLKSKAGTLDDVTTILRHNMGYGVFPLLIGLLV